MRLLFFLWLLLAANAYGFDHEHKAGDALLRKHVPEGLSRVSEAEFEAWSQQQQMAFLVNAYNAYAVGATSR